MVIQMDYEEHIRVLSYDVLSEEINGLRIEISELKNKEFDLECEVERLNMVINMLKKNDLWVSQEGWEESDKDDELLVSMHFLINKALELRGDFND